MPGLDASSIIPLYRRFLRQARRFPDPFVCEFLRIRAYDEFRQIVRARLLPKTKLKRVRKEVVRLEKANEGDPVALRTVLCNAYGRTGKLRWELTEPFRTDPKTPPQPRLIPPVEKSRPPSYPPALSTLLTDPLSRPCRPLTKKDLDAPPKLPPRADPTSKDAKLYGPFSLRREVNIRKRFYDYETTRLLPPLEMVTRQNVDPRPLGRLTPLGGLGLGQHLDYLAGGDLVPPIPKRQLQREGLTQPQPPSPRISAIPRRCLRRAYQDLLRQSPIMHAARSSNKFNATGQPQTVFALSKPARGATANQGRPRPIKASEIEWVRKGDPETEINREPRNRPDRTEI